MSRSGQNAKYSPRVNFVRFAFEPGHCATPSAPRVCADFVAKVGCWRWAVGHFVRERPILIRCPDALDATRTLRGAQSLSGRWPSDQRCEPSQILGDGG